MQYGTGRAIKLREAAIFHNNNNSDNMDWIDCAHVILHSIIVVVADWLGESMAGVLLRCCSTVLIRFPVIINH